MEAIKWIKKDKTVYLHCVYNQSWTGHFIYLKPVNFGGEALLLSKPYNPTFGSCLTFWYYQRGGDVGTIFVSIVPVGEEITPSSIWRMDDDQGTQWHLAAINIENAEQFQVIF